MIDMGTGTGAFALMAAKAGADSVVACDLHETMCNVARKVPICLHPCSTPPTFLPSVAADARFRANRISLTFGIKEAGRAGAVCSSHESHDV